jgi:hypothetical protein
MGMETKFQIIHTRLTYLHVRIKEISQVFWLRPAVYVQDRQKYWRFFNWNNNCAIFLCAFIIKLNLLSMHFKYEIHWLNIVSWGGV